METIWMHSRPGDDAVLPHIGCCRTSDQFSIALFRFGVFLKVLTLYLLRNSRPGIVLRTGKSLTMIQSMVHQICPALSPDCAATKLPATKVAIRDGVVT